MNDKPVMKSEIAISYVHVTGFSFYATTDAAADIASFGKVESIEHERDLYVLSLDARYDLDEVLAYVRNYGLQAGGS